jgi:hypothetical protein
MLQTVPALALTLVALVDAVELIKVVVGVLTIAARSSVERTTAADLSALSLLIVKYGFD